MVLRAKHRGSPKVSIIIPGITGHWGPGPVNRMLASQAASQFKGDVRSACGPPAFVGFLDSNYRYKSVSTQIHYGTGLANIQYTGRNSPEDLFSAANRCKSLRKYALNRVTMGKGGFKRVPCLSYISFSPGKWVDRLRSCEGGKKFFSEPIFRLRFFNEPEKNSNSGPFKVSLGDFFFRKIP